MKKDSPLKSKMTAADKRQSSQTAEYPRDYDSFWETKKEIPPDELPAFSQIQFLKPDSQLPHTSLRQIEMPNFMAPDSCEIERKMINSAQQLAEDSRKKAKRLIFNQNLGNTETRGPSKSFQLQQISYHRGPEDDEDGASLAKTRNVTQKEPNLALANLKLIAQTRKRIMYFFKNFTSSGRKSYLSNFQVRWTIDDKSDDTSLNSKMCFLIRLLDALKQRILRASFQNHQYLGLINPHGILSRILLVLLTFFNTLFFLLFSIKIIYYGESEYDMAILDLTAIIWISEAVVQLNTKIYKGSNVISDRYLLAQNYFNKRAAYDAISITLFVFMPSEEVSRVICQIISFIKLINVLKDIEEVQKMICMSVKNYHFIQLINLVLKIVIFGHVVACAWYLIGQLELKVLGYEETWYDGGLGADYTWWKLYLESVYWSLTLLTTGSNVAGTLVQMLFTTVIMLLTTIMFGYMLNVTGDIISEFGQKDQHKQQDLNQINEYMRQNRISKELQARVNLDIENYYASNLDEFKSDRQAIISKISPSLQNLLQQEYCNSILGNIKIIKDKFSPELIQDLSLSLEEEYFLPDQVIFKEQQFTDLGLMFILQGSVELYQSFLGDEKAQKSIQKLNKGSCLGQVNFFTGQAYDRTAKSSEFTKIVKIKRDKFIEAARLREKDLQVFQELKDQLFVYENYAVIKEKCTFCLNSTHREAECHLIHLQKDGIYQKVRFFENVTQLRAEFRRNKILLHQNVQTIQENIRVFRISLKERVTAQVDENASNYSYKFQNTAFESQATEDVEEEDEEGDDEYTIRKELQPFSTINEESLNASQRKDPSSVIGQVWTLRISHKKAENLEGDMDYNPPLITSPQPQFEKPIDLNQMMSKDDYRNEGIKQDNLLLNESFNKRKDIISVNSPSLAPRRITSVTSATDTIQQDVQFTRQQTRKNTNQVKRMSHTHFHNNSSHFQSNNSNPLPNGQYHLQTSSNLQPNRRKLSEQIIHATTITEQNNIYTSQVINENTSKNTMTTITEWDFDKQLDYKYYFTKGNLKYILLKQAKKQKSRCKGNPKKKMNKTGLFASNGLIIV